MSTHEWLNDTMAAEMLRVEQLTRNGNVTTEKTNASPTLSVPLSVMDVIDEKFNVVYVAKVSPSEKATNGLSTAMLTVSDRVAETSRKCDQ